MPENDTAHLFRGLLSLLVDQHLRRVALQMALTDAGVPLTQSQIDRQYDAARADSQVLIRDVEQGTLADLQALVGVLQQSAHWRR